MREKLKECITECGRWLMDNAEAIAPDVEAMTTMTIRISFEPNEATTFNIDYDAIPLEAAKAWAKANRREQR